MRCCRAALDRIEFSSFRVHLCDAFFSVADHDVAGCSAHPQLFFAEVCDGVSFFFVRDNDERPVLQVSGRRSVHACLEDFSDDRVRNLFVVVCSAASASFDARVKVHDFQKI